MTTTPKTIDLEVCERFHDYLFDWDYHTYVVTGGYGSSKSYSTVEKIILKCLEERRKVLVVRQVYDTIRESCFDLFCEILEKCKLLDEAGSTRRSRNKVKAKTSPMQLTFPNGSKIIFKGMDKPHKLKSINGVSIVWLEEASEINYAGYKELVGRLRHPTLSLHMILTFNPIGYENWVYKHFFKRRDEEGNDIVILDDERLYAKRTIVKNGIYYHHSTVDDNPCMPAEYIKKLDEMLDYDPDMYRVARKGRFGANGRRVIPQFVVAESHEEVLQAIARLPKKHRFTGMDFGFEESYNAVLRVAVHDKKKYLYIYDEYYKNHMTDDRTAAELEDRGYRDELICADCEDPKAIAFYNQSGFKMYGCKKFHGSRLSNTRKIKRFKKIICSPNCENTIRELRDLTYKKDPRTDEMIYDEFNIDPHTFSAIWYALDSYEVADVKEQKRNSRKGEAA